MNELIKTTSNNDGEILVSGRELHEFLEVDSNYTTWFERMTEYGFAESVDFIPILEKSTGGRPKQDHALKIDMAKEISMIQRTDKGKQARLYFIEVEKEHKRKLDTSSLSPELQMFQGLFTALANQELETKRIESKVDSISEIVALNTVDWRKDSRELINKIAKTQGGFGAYREIQADIYRELDMRAASDVGRRLTNLRNRMAGEGVCKSKRDKTNKLDVIGEDKRLLEIYLAVVKEFAVKYGVWEDEF